MVAILEVENDFVIVARSAAYYLGVFPRLVVLPFLLLSLGVASPALAATKVALSYRVAENCPPVSEFESALRARGASLDDARATPRVSALDVAISESKKLP